MKNQGNNVGKVMLALLIVLGAMMMREVIASILIIIYAVGMFIRGEVQPDDPAAVQAMLLENTDMILICSAVALLVWIVVFGIIYRSNRKKEGLPAFVGKLNAKRVGSILLMGFGCQIAVDFMLFCMLIFMPNAMESYAGVVQSLGMGNSLISWVYVGLIAPIAEELVFRGVVYDYLRKHMNFITANIAQAVFFGLYHMNVIQGIYAFGLGMLLGWLAEKYGSVKESILLHMVVNLTGCIISQFMPEEWIKSLLGLFVLLFIGVIFLVFSIRTVKMEVVEKTVRNGDVDDSITDI